MRVLQVIGWAFLGVAAVMLAVTAVLYVRDWSFTRSAARAAGTVTALVPSSAGTNASSVSDRVRFTTADGRPVEFVETLSTSPPRHAVGDRVTVLYDHDEPTSAMLDDFWSHRLGVVIVSVFTGIFGVLGAVFSLIGVLAGRRRARIMRDGVPVMADFVETITDHHFRINGRHPFRVVAEARDPMGKVQRFTSELVRTDPTERLRGRKVRVIVDRSDGGYVVDLAGVVDDRDFWRAR